MENNLMLDYILKQDEQYHSHLMQVYEILETTLGKHCEKIISYQMPTYKAKRNVIHFACFKNHLGVYPGALTIEAFKAEFGEYKSTKGTLQINYKQDVPVELIKKMAMYSYELNK